LLPHKGEPDMATEVAALAPAPGLKKEAVWTFSGAHLMNDLMTVGIVPALLPLYKAHLHLNYTQTGMILLFSYLMSSVMQPLFGYLTDRAPKVWLLPLGVTLSCLGLALTGVMPTFTLVLVCISISGLGSGIFHPEAARGTHLAAGARKGLAQAIFQVGGNAGQALGPLMVTILVAPVGLTGLAWFLLLAVLAFLLTVRLLPWYRQRIIEEKLKKRVAAGKNRTLGLSLLLVVVVLRSWCQVGVAGFLPFYYEKHFHMTVGNADLFTFVFLGAGAIGTFFGGALSDRLGRKRLLVLSLVFSVPFAWLLPGAEGIYRVIVLFIFGFSILSSFAVGVVYAQMLLPRNIALASGLMIGLGVGAGGIGAFFLGAISDAYGVATVFQLLAFVPLLASAVSLFLPGDRTITGEA